MLSAPRTISFDIPTLGEPDITHRMVVHEWGDSNAKETLVCVHGLTRNARDFDVLAGTLAANYRVLCVDIAGRGKSEWLRDPKHYSYPDYASDMVQLLAALGLTKFHWVGTSMGGIIGMMVANALPGAMQSLILNDIGCFIAASGLSRIGTYVGIPPIFATRAEAESELRNRCAPYGISDESHWQHLFTHSILAMDDGRFRLAYDERIAVNLPKPEEVKDVNLWPLWEAVKPIPTLLIRGMNSDLLSHETATQMQQTHPRLSLLEIPNVGHAPALMDDIQINVIRQHIG